ncbi:conserved hypothetical protein [delta proteobacterium NaphS2]|nr:conserved hypothetical protein [delta proteobacterium NaphS2]
MVLLSASSSFMKGYQIEYLFGMADQIEACYRKAKGHVDSLFLFT